ncbi:hypothetical protein [Kitasatospora sp. NPDC057015]|uniref:hypothetical protein n=1 Tax=Kitasatospora sp. NPDC057015 TaxID=3346001 RepID=UPI003633F7E8
MIRTRRMTGLAASVIGLVSAGTMLAAAPAAQAAVGPEGCTAYVSHTDEHTAVGWCARGNGTWYVKAKCAGPGRVNGPYVGSQGKRSMGREQASTVNCGTSGWPIEMSVVNIKA